MDVRVHECSNEGWRDWCTIDPLMPVLIDTCSKYAVKNMSEDARMVWSMDISYA